MPKRVEKVIPTDREIMSYRNVPVEVAARYLGMSTTTIKNALQQERAPFGFASQNPEKGSFTYQISPDRLIRYQSGELPMYRINEIMEMAAAGVEDILNQRLEYLNVLMGAIEQKKVPARRRHT